MKAKILIWDIETAPIIGTAWSKYDTNLVWVIEDWYILGYAYKWHGEREVHTVMLPDFPTYKKDPKNDIELVRSLHKLMEEADITIAHNGDKFDNRKTNARILKHNLLPISQGKTIDTLKVSRKYFALTSYRLDDLAQYLNVGSKIKTDKTLWERCMAGDEIAWNKMRRYNKRDVNVLEKVYLKLRPWIINHPPINILTQDPESCPKCGSGKGFQKRGYQSTKTNRYQRVQCVACGGWSRYRVPEKIMPERRMTYVN